MAEVDGKPVCAVVPVGLRSQHEKLAGAFGAKTAKMMRPADAERPDRLSCRRLYRRSGRKKRVPVAIEEAALGHASVFLNGGQRGLASRARPPRRREGGRRDRAPPRGVSGLASAFALALASASR
jgi:Cys-tRNA(Pro)/Cys-tRNA(Cys) deacylase